MCLFYYKTGLIKLPPIRKVMENLNIKCILSWNYVYKLIKKWGRFHHKFTKAEAKACFMSTECIRDLDRTLKKSREKLIFVSLLTNFKERNIF